ncbi:MAG: VOC family protein [Rubrivivax sp.]
MSTTLTPYLAFDGNTREAFAFYAKALGATVQTMLSYDDMPASATADTNSNANTGEGCGGAMPSGPAIMHGALALPGGARLFAGDTPPNVRHEAIKGVMLALEYDTVEQAQTAFDALAQGGRVTMPLAPSFWSKIFGMVTDRFGVSWAVNGEPIALN